MQRKTHGLLLALLLLFLMPLTGKAAAVNRWQSWGPRARRWKKYKLCCPDCTTTMAI